MAKERALDVFDLLSKLDRKDYDVWDSLSAEQKKEFSGLVTMRWMAGTFDPYQLVMLNEIVNTSVYQHGEAHKEFTLKLLTVCSNGKSKRYEYPKYKMGGGKKQKRAIELIATHYKLNHKDAEDSRQLFTDDEILELAEIHGWQKDEIQELKKELK